jgi:hypothetical protein
MKRLLLTYLLIQSFSAFAESQVIKLLEMKNQGLITEEVFRKKMIELESNSQNREIASESNEIKVYRFTNPPLDIK